MKTRAAVFFGILAVLFLAGCTTQTQQGAYGPVPGAHYVTNDRPVSEQLPTPTPTPLDVIVPSLQRSIVYITDTGEWKGLILTHSFGVAGSGVIVLENGPYVYALTNRHVVDYRWSQKQYQGKDVNVEAEASTVTTREGGTYSQ